MKDMMQAFNEREIKWSQWTPQGKIGWGVSQYKQVMEWVQMHGIVAKNAVMNQKKDHAVYARVFHDDEGKITEIRLYIDAFMTDEELDAVQSGNLDRFFVAHK